MAETDIRKINEMAKADPRGLVLSAEASYKNYVEEIASRVAKNSDIRIILLAGPSGSGKTTTANLIADKIRHQLRRRLSGL